MEGNFSVAEMEPSGEEVSMEPQIILKPKEVINVLTGIFLKMVFFLDHELLKCVIVGISKNRNNSLGILFKGKKGSVFWSRDVFNQFNISTFNNVTIAVEEKKKFSHSLDTGESIKVNSVFGKQHVFIHDGEHTFTLNSSEWVQFINSLPLVYTHLSDLFPLEEVIQEFITEVLGSEEGSEKPPPLPRFSTQLYNELLLYKRWPFTNGSGC